MAAEFLSDSRQEERRRGAPSRQTADSVVDPARGVGCEVEQQRGRGSSGRSTLLSSANEGGAAAEDQTEALEALRHFVVHSPPPPEMERDF